MNLNTERLRLIPLKLDEFKLLLEEGVEKMESHLGLAHSGEVLDDHTQKALEYLYSEALKNPNEYLWYTNWQIVLKESNLMIGSADFMGCPDEDGEVEIGYGIHEVHRNQGYMTEALAALFSWALKQKNVHFIMAETEPSNIASQKVLLNCGMKKYDENGEGCFWRLTKLE